MDVDKTINGFGRLTLTTIALVNGEPMFSKHGIYSMLNAGGIPALTLQSIEDPSR